MGCLKCYFEKDIITNISQFKQLMDVAINFVIFRSVPWGKLALDHVVFMRPTPRERVSISQRTLDHKVLACKSENPVKSRVSNERSEAEIV